MRKAFLLGVLELIAGYVVAVLRGDWEMVFVFACWLGAGGIFVALMVSGTMLMRSQIRNKFGLESRAERDRRNMWVMRCLAFAAPNIAAVIIIYNVLE